MCIRLAKEIPYRIDDRVPVCVDAQIFRFYVVSGEVEIFDSVHRHVEHEFFCIVFVVDAIDDDVVDIEQQVAVRFVNDRS